MITEQDLIEAIAECQGERNPNANTCIKLAAYLTIKNNLYSKEPMEEKIVEPTYSYDDGMENIIQVPGRSEFLRLAYGKNIEDILAIMDELMETLQLINPRLYESVMRKL